MRARYRAGGLHASPRICVAALRPTDPGAPCAIGKQVGGWVSIYTPRAVVLARTSVCRHMSPRGDIR